MVLAMMVDHPLKQFYQKFTRGPNEIDIQIGGSFGGGPPLLSYLAEVGGGCQDSSNIDWFLIPLTRIAIITYNNPFQKVIILQKTERVTLSISNLQHFSLDPVGKLPPRTTLVVSLIKSGCSNASAQEKWSLSQNPSFQSAPKPIVLLKLLVPNLQSRKSSIQSFRMGAMKWIQVGKCSGLFDQTLKKWTCLPQGTWTNSASTLMWSKTGTRYLDR